ncbi:MAG: radical SAM protein [Elusimicrobiota bacterium]
MKEFIGIRSEEKEARHLRRLNLIVAQRCNSRCSYCYAGDGDYGEGRLMTLDIARTAIEGALSKFDEVKSIQFFGGEPLLASKLIEQAINYAEEAAARLGRPTPVFTAISNLTILPENIFRLVQTGKLNIVTSLDGPAQFHDRNRRLASGRPTYDAVVRNIRKLIPFSQPRAIEATYTA